MSYSPNLCRATVHRQCDGCPTTSLSNIWPQVYAQGWVCLNASCHKFWQMDDGEELPISGLEYNPNFLQLPPSPPLSEEYHEILPEQPKVMATSGIHPTTKEFRLGWHCRDCGRLSSRYSIFLPVNGSVAKTLI
jgi:hypothetical protein